MKFTKKQKREFKNTVINFIVNVFIYTLVGLMGSLLGVAITTQLNSKAIDNTLAIQHTVEVLDNNPFAEVGTVACSDININGIKHSNRKIVIRVCEAY